MISKTYIALNRLGLGISPQDLKNCGLNRTGWIESQINRGHAQFQAARLQHSSQIVSLIRQTNMAKGEDRKPFVKKGREIHANEMKARLDQSLNSDTPFLERLTYFWSNHFTVSTRGKNILQSLVGSFEREAIRPHILGNFYDMLLASTTHPAMLIYLDNAQSIGPNSQAGTRRSRGLNENLAREIMELHTLGVNGGYSQKDFTNFAKVLTGWNFKPENNGGNAFVFQDFRHEPGAQIILGRTYDQKGQDQGLAVLRDLARHSATAEFIARKMVRHFIADDPPEDIVQELANVFKTTGGDLKAMTRAMVSLKALFDEPYSKFKTPYELVISTLRLNPKERDDKAYAVLAKTFVLMDHVPFAAPSPAGWGDTADDWASPNAVMNRVEWCHATAQQVAPQSDPKQIAKELLGPLASIETLKWIGRAPSAVDGLALFLASPEWQRR